METRVFKTNPVKLAIDTIARTLSLAIVYGILISVFNVPHFVAAIVLGFIWAAVIVVLLRSAIMIKIDDLMVTFVTKGKTYTFDRDKNEFSAHLSKLGLASLSVHHKDGTTSFDISSLSTRVSAQLCDELCKS